MPHNQAAYDDNRRSHPNLRRAERNDRSGSGAAVNRGIRALVGHSLLAGAAVYLMFMGEANAQQIVKADQLDIVGLQIGMGRSEAEKALLSHNPAFKIKQATEVIILPTGQPAVDVNTGARLQYLTRLEAEHHDGDTRRFGMSSVIETVVVAFAGAPGMEVVGSIGRAVSFDYGKEPLVAIVADGIKKKYGQRPTDERDDNSGYERKRKLTWYFDLSGRYREDKIGPEWRPEIDGCLLDTENRLIGLESRQSKAGVRYLGPLTRGIENCGPMLNAKVIARNDNPAIAAAVVTFLSNGQVFKQGEAARNSYIAAIWAALQAKDIEAAKQRTPGVKF